MAETTAEIHSRGLQIAEVIKKVLDDVQLRKWCLEQALKSSSDNPTKLAHEMMMFIAAPGREFLDDL